MAVFLESGFALFLGGGLVVGDVGQVALLLVAVVALDGAIVHDLLDLQNLHFKLETFFALVTIIEIQSHNLLY